MPPPVVFVRVARKGVTRAVFVRDASKELTRKVCVPFAENALGKLEAGKKVRGES
jgi:hypothetical protein